MAAVLSTDLLSNLQMAQPGQRSGFCGACSDVYGAVRRTLLFCGPFYSRKWFIKALSLSVISTLDKTSLYSRERMCEEQCCHSLLVLKCRVSSWGTRPKGGLGCQNMSTICSGNAKSSSHAVLVLVTGLCCAWDWVLTKLFPVRRQDPMSPRVTPAAGLPLCRLSWACAHPPSGLEVLPAQIYWQQLLVSMFSWNYLCEKHQVYVVCS